MSLLKEIVIVFSRFGNLVNYITNYPDSWVIPITKLPIFVARLSLQKAVDVFLWRVLSFQCEVANDTQVDGTIGFYGVLLFWLTVLIFFGALRPSELDPLSYTRHDSKGLESVCQKRCQTALLNNKVSNCVIVEINSKTKKNNWLITVYILKIVI